jgi:hypothetical protein
MVFFPTVLDCLYGSNCGYTGMVLLFENLDVNNLNKSFEMITHFFKSKFSFDIIFMDCNSLDLKYFINNYYNNRNNRKRKRDIIITVIQKEQYYVLFIESHHFKVDGELLFNIIDYWSNLYEKKTQVTYNYNLLTPNIMCEHTGYYPVNKILISSLKKKYPFSDYVITTTLWSYFISQNTKYKTFGHVISYRTPNTIYSIGNYHTVQKPLKMCDLFYDSCLLLKNTIIKTKSKIHYSKSISHLLNCIRSDIIFDSWLTYKHIEFDGKKCKGIYSTLHEYNNMHHTNIMHANSDNLFVVTFFDDYYYLSKPINGCNSDNFATFINTFFSNS